MVRWSEQALNDLSQIRDFVARSSPGYAQALADRSVQKTEVLEAMPDLGAEVPEYQDEALREVLEHPYRIIYRNNQGDVEILAVVHGSRRLPRNPPG